jgi:hypothetical protein
MNISLALRFVAVVLVAAGLASPAMAQVLPNLPGSPASRPAASRGSELAKLSIVPDPIRIEAGGTALVAAVLSIEPGWHVYWRNPGDSGMPPSLRWTLPEGLVARAIRWPRPMVFTSEHETTYGYEREVGLVVEVEAAAEAKVGVSEGSVRGEWMVCKELCQIGGGTVRFQVEVLAAGDPAAEGISIRAGEAVLPRDPVVRRWFGRLPLPARGGIGIESTIAGDPASGAFRLLLTGPSGTFERVGFIPDSTPGTTCGTGHPVSGAIDNGRFRVEVPVEVRPQDAVGERLRLAGLLVLGEKSDDPAFEIEVSIPVTPSPRGKQ